MEKLNFIHKRIYPIALQLCLCFLFAGAQKCFAVSPPTISPNGGLFLGPKSVSISAAAGTIFFTVDGSTPTTSSSVYSSSLTLNETTTVQAIAVQSGVSSSVTTAKFICDPMIQPMILSAGPYWWLRSDIGVTTSSGLVSSWLNQTQYSGNASQSSSSNQPSLILNALNGYPSIRTGSNRYLNMPSTNFESLGAPGFYFVTKPNSTANGALVDFALNTTGAYDVNCSVAAPGATYTIYQGTTPGSLTATSAVTVGQYGLLVMNYDLTGTQANIYTNGNLDATGALTTPQLYFRYLNHIGTDYTTSNFYDGDLLELALFTDEPPNQPEPYFLTRYQILTQNPAAPLISVPTGSLSGPTQVAISVPADCVCKYTLDGTTPTSTSQSYSEPINVFYSQTINAIAIKNGFSSSVATATYTLDSTQWPSPNPSDTSPLQINIQSPN